jgi:hypothetical protein
MLKDNQRASGRTRLTSAFLRRGSPTGAPFRRLTVLKNSTICTIVKEIQLTRPELAFTIATRAMIGAGIALLLADRLSVEQRKAVGFTLTLVGLVTTIPAAWAVFGKCE